MIDAGAAHVLVQPQVWSLRAIQFWNQDSMGISDLAEADHFGDGALFVVPKFSFPSMPTLA